MARLPLACIASTLLAAAACSTSASTIPAEDDAPETDGGTRSQNGSHPSQPVDRVADSGDATTPAAAPCKLTEPFGTLTAVPNGAQYTRAFVSDDELSIYWDRVNGGQGITELLRATRMNTSDPFTNAQPLPNVNQGKTQFSPSMTADGLTLTFLAIFDGKSGNEFRIAKRGTTMEDFAPSTAMPAFSPTTNVRSVRISPDGKAVFWSADKNIYQRIRDTSGDFGAPLTVAKGEQPVLSPDGLDLYFAGETGTMVAHRSSEGAPSFGTPVAVPEISPPYSYPVAVTPNNCRIYFYYGGKGLYFATRPAP